jgi:hypothetical protein
MDPVKVFWLKHLLQTYFPFWVTVFYFRTYVTALHEIVMTNMPTPATTAAAGNGRRFHRHYTATKAYT